MPNIQTRINAAFDYFAGDLRPYQKNGSYLDKDELPFFVCLKSTAPISPKHNIALATCSVKLTALRDFFPFRPVFTKSVGLKTNFNRGFSRCFVYKNKYHSCLSHEDGGLLLTYPIRCHALFIFFWK